MAWGLRLGRSRFSNRSRRISGISSPGGNSNWAPEPDFTVLILTTAGEFLATKSAKSGTRAWARVALSSRRTVQRAILFIADASGERSTRRETGDSDVEQHGLPAGVLPGPPRQPAHQQAPTRQPQHGGGGGKAIPGHLGLARPGKGGQDQQGHQVGGKGTLEQQIFLNTDGDPLIDTDLAGAASIEQHPDHRAVTQGLAQQVLATTLLGGAAATGTP